MKAEKLSTKVNHTSAENRKTNAEIGGADPKKPYNAPQVIEHGSVEQITGAVDGYLTYSGTSG